MTRADIVLPRRLEATGQGDHVRRFLGGLPTFALPGGALDLPIVALTGPLKNELARTALSRRLTLGFDLVSEQLAREGRGIQTAGEREGKTHGKRISRLVILSRDGSERFYRRIEGLLKLEQERVMGCLLDCDSVVLGSLARSGRRPVKVLMAEHKDSVASILCAIAGVENPF